MKLKGLGILSLVGVAAIRQPSAKIGEIHPLGKSFIVRSTRAVEESRW